MITFDLVWEEQQYGLTVRHDELVLITVFLLITFLYTFIDHFMPILYSPGGGAIFGVLFLILDSN